MKGSPNHVVAKGTFEVSRDTAVAAETTVSGVRRTALDKRFSGDLSGTSRLEMLSILPGVAGSAGYVALELVNGSLDGKRGGFALQHFGVMSGEKQELRISVVPDSGTDELHGLAGEMTIKIEEGHHEYEFFYSIPAVH